jgi:eukaryotic-like serine/threonine-protein kinase
MKICLQCGNKYPDDATFCSKDGLRLAPMKDIDSTVASPESGLHSKYKIIEMLGQGGMGTVYKAEHVLMNRTVAIKILHSQSLTDPSAVERFKREAQLASKLSHPNAITLHDFGIEEGSPYLVMEYVEGKTLGRIVASDGMLSTQRIVAILSQVCTALAEAHRQGIVHRDLKPDNIMVTLREDGTETAKLLDFGLSKVIGAENVNLTQTGMVVGTPKYMSPEQTRDQALDARSDIYSVGVILYELLSGRAPFVAQDKVDLLVKHLHEEPAPLDFTKDGAAIPQALAQVARKALSKEPEKRQQNMEQFINELEQAASTVEKSAADSTTQVMRTISESGTDTVTAKHWGRVFRAASFMALALCALLVLALAFVVIRHRALDARRAKLQKGVSLDEDLPVGPGSAPQATITPVRQERAEQPLRKEVEDKRPGGDKPPPAPEQDLGGNIIKRMTQGGSPLNDANRPPFLPGWYVPIAKEVMLRRAMHLVGDLRRAGLPAIMKPEMSGVRPVFVVLVGPYEGQSKAQSQSNSIEQATRGLPNINIGQPVLY